MPIFKTKCKFWRTCKLYRKNAVTCNEDAGFCCGRYRILLYLSKKYHKQKEKN